MGRSLRTLYIFSQILVIYLHIIAHLKLSIGHNSLVQFDMKGNALESSLVVQRVRELGLSLKQLRSLQWHRFDPWPGNFHVQQAGPKKRKKKKASCSLLSRLKCIIYK